MTKKPAGENAREMVLDESSTLSDTYDTIITNDITNDIVLITYNTEHYTSLTSTT